MGYAAWAVEVLARYGRHHEARDAAERLLDLEPDWGWYNPISGEPAGGPRGTSAQCSRTAAARVVLRRILERLPS